MNNSTIMAEMLNKHNTCNLVEFAILQLFVSITSKGMMSLDAVPLFKVKFRYII